MGLTNSDPNQVTPRPGNYFLCAFNGPSPGPPNYSLTVKCNADTQPGRYLVVQHVNVNEPLTLCEVQVSGSPAPVTSNYYFFE